jgi:Na+/H+ antiporter NhaD/arsenite permease-like protein
MGMGIGPMVPFSVIVLAASFILIAVRQIGGLRLKIWQVILIGALAVLLTGQISMQSAISSVDWTVIAFLICIFIVGEAFTESGYVQYISYRIFRSAKSVDSLVLLVILSMGLASMLLLNDTLAVIGTPIVMLFATREKINPKLMLLSLAFAVTIGSVASPIGNPQNFLIASSGIVKNPFPTFFSYLIIPTIINLFAAYLILRVFYRKEFHNEPLIHAKVEIKDKRLAWLCKISFLLLVLSIMLDIALISFNVPLQFNLSYVAVIASLPIIIFSEKRYELIRKIDWHTIIFFMALFVLVGSVWDSGFIQGIVSSMNLQIGSVPTILVVSIVGSQFISNVPMVLLYLKLLAGSSVSAAAAVALAAGSTIAGNLFILGAASNVIIVQKAEKSHGQTLSFMDFVSVGVVLTLLNIFIYWVFLSL